MGAHANCKAKIPTRSWRHKEGRKECLCSSKLQQMQRHLSGDAEPKSNCASQSLLKRLQIARNCFEMKDPARLPNQKATESWKRRKAADQDRLPRMKGGSNNESFADSWRRLRRVAHTGKSTAMQGQFPGRILGASPRRNKERFAVPENARVGKPRLFRKAVSKRSWSFERGVGLGESTQYGRRTGLEIEPVLLHQGGGG